jgi:hypothetical protein
MRTFVAGVKPQGTIEAMKERAFIIFGLRDRRAARNASDLAQAAKAARFFQTVCGA